MKPDNVETPPVTPVILAGGTGTRLWPVSRKHYPKQFSDFFGAHTLFQQSALRLRSSGNLVFDHPVIVSGSDFRFVIGEQLMEAGIIPGSILVEPAPRNTAAAILAATLHQLKNNPDAILLVAPSDHVITDVKAFHLAIEAGIGQANRGDLVIFGIPPTGPETGYGYLKFGNPDANRCAPVETFVEKPDLETAEKMVKDGSCYWNAGIFLFRASDMLKAFEHLKPHMIEPVISALDNGVQDLDFFRLEETSWNNCESISIDHAIIEHVENLSATPLMGGWSDLGSWDALKAHSGKADEQKNILYGKATAIECSHTMLRSEHKGQHVVGLGLENINAIAMQDSVLIMDAGKSQDVGKAVELMRVKGISQADAFAWEHRPWGRFDVLVEQSDFKVKRISVKPGGVLSLQKHQHRAEHWVVVAGTAKVTVDGNTTILNAGESVSVPLGAVHRMENHGDIPMIIIEVQTGDYLGEDDIVRFEDVYARQPSE